MTFQLIQERERRRMTSLLGTPLQPAAEVLGPQVVFGPGLRPYLLSSGSAG